MWKVGSAAASNMLVMTRTSSSSSSWILRSNNTMRFAAVMSLSSMSVRRASPTTTIRLVVRSQQQLQQQQQRGMAEMPVPQSSKAVLFEGHPKKEGWESTIYWLYGTSSIFLVLILAFSPQTDITTWANHEAQARLALKEQNPDMVFEFGKHYYGMSREQQALSWDKFSSKAVHMSDDDDDDDEDEESEGVGEDEEEEGDGGAGEESDEDEDDE